MKFKIYRILNIYEYTDWKSGCMIYMCIVLKMCRLSSFCVFYITFYNIQNYVKSPLKMQEMAFQRV